MSPSSHPGRPLHAEGRAACPPAAAGVVGTPRPANFLRRRPLVLAAAAVMLVSNLWVLISAQRNRAEAVGGTVELTERELELPPRFGDSTVLLLNLRWDMPSANPKEDPTPDWLTEAKFTELGFDCHVPPTQSEARDHYEAQLPAPAWLVLEYEGPTWQARGDPASHRTRLFAVDAGRDARPLRQKYPDPTRHVICRGVVRVFLRDRNRRDGTPLVPPRLGGHLEVVPGQIFVPSRYSRLLQRWQVPDGEAREEVNRPPRYAVKLAWGTRYEPWVQDVRELP